MMLPSTARVLSKESSALRSDYKVIDEKMRVSFIDRLACIKFVLASAIKQLRGDQLAQWVIETKAVDAPVSDDNRALLELALLYAIKQLDDDQIISVHGEICSYINREVNKAFADGRLVRGSGMTMRYTQPGEGTETSYGTRTGD